MKRLLEQAQDEHRQDHESGEPVVSDAPLAEERSYGRGGAVIVEPAGGDVIAGPLYDREGMLVADCDLRAGLHAKRWFDAVGHYSRADVLAERRPRGPGSVAGVRPGGETRAR